MLAFIAGIAALVVALYIPGTLVFRALGFTWLHAIVAAPLYGAFVVGVLPIAYYELGVSCTVVSIMGPALLLAIAAYLASRAWRGKKGRAFGFPTKGENVAERDSLDDWKLAGLYVACGIVVCAVVFGASLPTPDAAYIRYDNQTHLSVSKSFLDSGMWSSLHPNRYLDLDASVRPFTSGESSFYPSLLYALSALDALMSGLPVTGAFNAVLFTLCAVVFPLGMFAVMRVAFKADRMAIALGAIATVAFAAFPWGVFVRGLFPNAAGYCLMAPALGSTMALLSVRMSLRTFARGVALWICALPALALAQPNAVFAAFLFIAAFTAHRVGEWRAQAVKPGKNPLLARCLGAGVVVAVALVIWVICLKLPPLASVVHYFGNTPQKPLSSVGRVLLLKFDPFECQYVLALLVIIGVVACIRKRVLWPLAPALWMAAAYFIIRTQNNPVAHFLAGFWYCDHVRIAAALSIFEMPIAALGIATVAKGAMRLAGRGKHGGSETRKRAFAGVAVGVICLCVFCPNLSAPGGKEPVLKTGYGTVYTEIRNMYREKDNRVYGSDEQAFVNEAVKLTGDDLVLNYPADGSSFAYAANDMNVYYRTFKTKGQTDTAKEIRTGLNKYAKHKKVRAAVESTGARWLLKLDQGATYEDGKWFRQYHNPEQFTGIEKVDDDTPGFTVVLSEGDMRLYRID